MNITFKGFEYAYLICDHIFLILLESNSTCKESCHKIHKTNFNFAQNIYDVQLGTSMFYKTYIKLCYIFK